MSGGSDSRYPLEARGVGVMQHHRQKTYMLSVLWSDHNNVLIYRTFEEFKKLDRELRRKFPLEAGFLRKSERVIPKLRDVPLLFRRNKTRSHRLLERLQLLATYSHELFCTDPKISQAQDVTQFFTPQTKDLKPSFPQDSIVIMPSEVGDKTKEPVSTEPHAPVTQPVVSQRYVCIEAYETKDTKNRPFKVMQNEALGVLLKDTTGWWLVENEEKQLAWFPAPYLKQHVSVGEIGSARSCTREGLFYFAAKGYEAQSFDEISVAAGVIVEVLEESENGWWLVWYNGKAGYVPSMYLQPYTNPHQKLQVVLIKDAYGSIPNLHTIGSSDANTLPLRRASEGNPLQSSKVNRSKKQLEKTRSRSLTCLPTVMENEVRSPLPLKPESLAGNSNGGSNQNVNMGLIHSPLLRNLPEVKRTEVNLSAASRQHLQLSPPLGQERKDSGFDDTSSASGSDSSLNSLDLDSNLPKIPPRPKAHEILQHCSTVTKRTIERSRAKRELVASSNADQLELV